jgi:hypothetical protein
LEVWGWWVASVLRWQVGVRVEGCGSAVLESGRRMRDEVDEMDG